MTKMDQIQEKWPNLGDVFHFECLVWASENFPAITNDWNLLRTSRVRKYLPMKKIPRLTQARLKRHHICRHYPLGAHTMKI